MAIRPMRRRSSATSRAQPRTVRSYQANGAAEAFNALRRRNERNQAASQAQAVGRRSRGRRYVYNASSDQWFDLKPRGSNRPSEISAAKVPDSVRRRYG